MGKACQVQLTTIPLTKQAEDGGGSHVCTLGQVLWDRETIQKEDFGRSTLLVLYVILHNILGISLFIPTGNHKIKSATVFGTNKRVNFTKIGKGITLNLDTVPTDIDYIVELTL